MFSRAVATLGPVLGVAYSSLGLRYGTCFVSRRKYYNLKCRQSTRRFTIFNLYYRVPRNKKCCKILQRINFSLLLMAYLKFLPNPRSCLPAIILSEATAPRYLNFSYRRRFRGLHRLRYNTSYIPKPQICLQHMLS